jgi:hypothetical protein
MVLSKEVPADAVIPLVLALGIIIGCKVWVGWFKNYLLNTKKCLEILIKL